MNMPGLGSITGHTSSITNSFVGAIIPVIDPTEADIAEALAILNMLEDDIRCAYCGDPATEWDHLRPLVRDKQPTGHISEIGNLVPCCGKCNQSKGNKPWREWILSNARMSPATRNTPGLEARIHRLTTYEQTRPRKPLNFRALVGEESWAVYWQNHSNLVAAMKKSQEAADELRRMIQNSGAI